MFEDKELNTLNVLLCFTEHFMETTRLSLNLCFSKTSHLYDIKISAHVTLESVKCVKILGVQVDRLSFIEHIAGLCKQVGQTH